MANREKLGVECKWVRHIRANDYRPDLHIVKERIHYSDGTTEPNLRLIEEYERPFYVTAPAYRNHEQKKEREHISKLIEHQSTQSNLRNSVAVALGKRYARGGLKQLSISPYLYGSDTSSSAIIKQAYRDAYDQEFQSMNDVVTLDIETDVLSKSERGYEPIIIQSVSSKDKIVVAILKSFIGDISNPKEKLEKLMEKYIGDYIKKRGMEVEFAIFDDEEDVIRYPIFNVHKWKPDILSIWNYNFDVNQIARRAEVLGMDVAKLWHDESIPEEYRSYYFKEGPAQKISAKGRVTPLQPSQRWHDVETTSGFYIIDAMCAYRLIRTGSQDQPSYALDNILNAELGVRKLKFDEADHLTGLDQHKFLQEKYPLEYIIYNVFDSLSMQELDDKTLDMKLSILEDLGNTEISMASRRTRRGDDTLYFINRENGYIMGTVPGKPREEEEDPDAPDPTPPLDVMSLDDWIVTLPAYLTYNNGIKCLSDNPDAITNIRTFVSDSDITSSYPSCIDSLNTSKETTHREVISVEGIHVLELKKQSVNLIYGGVNSVEYCTTMFKMPKLSELDEMVEKEIAKEAIEV